MLGFSYEKNADEIIEMINMGLLDIDIKKYCKELLEEKENINNIMEYFDITFLDEECGYSIVGAEIDTEQKYNNLSRKEKQLLNVFQLRIESIYNNLLNTKDKVVLTKILELLKLVQENQKNLEEKIDIIIKQTNK